MGNICSSHESLYRAFLSTRSTILGEPQPVSLLSWSRGGLVIDHKRSPPMVRLASAAAGRIFPWGGPRIRGLRPGPRVG